MGSRAALGRTRLKAGDPVSASAALSSDHQAILGVLEAGPSTLGEISTAVGAPRRRVAQLLGTLAHQGLARRADRFDTESKWLAMPKLGVAGGPRQLPIARVIPLGPCFALGAGERREGCRKYERCLDTFDEIHPDADEAHCPPACRHFEPVPRHALHEISSTRYESQFTASNW